MLIRKFRNSVSNKSCAVLFVAGSEKIINCPVCHRRWRFALVSSKTSITRREQGTSEEGAAVSLLPLLLLFRFRPSQVSQNWSRAVRHGRATLCPAGYGGPAKWRPGEGPCWVQIRQGNGRRVDLPSTSDLQS